MVAVAVAGIVARGIGPALFVAEVDGVGDVSVITLDLRLALEAGPAIALVIVALFDVEEALVGLLAMPGAACLSIRSCTRCV